MHAACLLIVMLDVMHDLMLWLYAVEQAGVSSSASWTFNGKHAHKCTIAL
jgi:hypothetical protein